jgi:hypothetical protein
MKQAVPFFAGWRRLAIRRGGQVGQFARRFLGHPVKQRVNLPSRYLRRVRGKDGAPPLMEDRG